MSRKKLQGKKGKSCGYFGESKDYYYGGYNDYDYYYGGYTFHPKYFSISRTSNYKTYSSTYNYSLRHIYGVDHKYSSFYSRRKGWKCKLSLLRSSSTSSLKNLPRAKNIKKLAKNIALMDQALLDCYGRFIALLPHSLLKDPIHLYFQFQDTYWWYTDIWQEKYPDVLPKLSLKLFGYLICDDCDILKKYVPLEKHEKNYATWKKYCKTIPLRGAIILNHDLKKCLLVKGWSRACWSFPRGKIDEREKDARCAGREIYEELGVDISSYIDKRVYLETYVEKQSIKLYIIPGVSEDTKFEPRTRKEIGDIRWFEINKLPTPNNLTVDSSIFKSSNERINDIFVAPFIPGLKKWISLFRLIHIDQNKSESDESRDPFIACRYAIAKMDKETLKKVQQINYSEEEDDTLLQLCDEWDEWGEQEDVEKRELRKKERREKKKELEEERIKELIRVLKKEEEQKRRELMRLMKLEEEEGEKQTEEKEEKEENQTQKQVVQDENEEQIKQQQQYVWKEENQLEQDWGLQREKTAQEKELMRVLKVGQFSESSISNEKKKKKEKKKKREKEKKMQEKEKEKDKDKNKEENKEESEIGEKKEKGNESDKEKQENKKSNVSEVPQTQAPAVRSELCKYEPLSAYDKGEGTVVTQDIYRNIYEQLFGKRKKNLKKSKEKSDSKENSGEQNICSSSAKTVEKGNNEIIAKVEEENKIVIVNEYENLMKREDEQEQKEERNIIAEKEQNEKKDKEENEEENKDVKDNMIKEVGNSVDPLKAVATKKIKSSISKSKNIRETGYSGYSRGAGKYVPSKRDLHRWSKYDDGHYGEEKGYEQVYDMKYDKLTQKPSYNSPFKKLKEIGLKSYDEYSASRMKKKYGPKFYGSSIYMYGYYMNDYNSYKIRGRAKLNFSSVERVGNANTYKIKKHNAFTNKKAVDKAEDNQFVKKTYTSMKQDAGRIMPHDKMQKNLPNGVVPEKEKEMSKAKEKEKEKETEKQREKEANKENENIKEKEREKEKEKEKEGVRVKDKENEEWKGHEKEREKEREQRNSEKREPKKIIKKVLLRKEKKDVSGETDKGYVYEQSSNTTYVGNIHNTHTLETKTEQNISGVKYLPKTKKEEEAPIVSKDRQNHSQKSKKNKKHNKNISNEFHITGSEVNASNVTINGIHDKKHLSNSVKKRDDVQEEKKVPKRVLIRNSKVNKEEKSQERDNSKKPDAKNSNSNGSICLSSSNIFTRDTPMNSMLLVGSSGGEYGYTTQEKEKEKGNERKRELFIFGRDEKSKEEIKKMLISKLMEKNEFTENRNGALNSGLKRDDSEIKISQEELVQKNEAAVVVNSGSLKKKKKKIGKELSTYKEDVGTETETEETIPMVNNDTETDKKKKIETEQYGENVRSKITNISKITTVSKGVKQSKVKTEEMEISVKDDKDGIDGICKPIKKERLSKVRYKQKHLNSDFENPFDIFDHWADEEVDKKKKKKKKGKKKEKSDGRNEEEVEEEEEEEQETEEDDLEIYTRYERERILNAQTRKKAL